MLLLLTGGIAFADDFTSVSPAFHMRVPEGFRPFAEGKDRKEILCAYIRGTPGTDGTEMIRVEALGGTIGREPLTLEGGRQYVPPGTALSLETYEWQGFEVQGIRARLKVNGHDATSVTVQVPLRKEAIQVEVGDIGKGDPRETVQSVLRGLQGESNWLTDQERGYKLGSGIGRLVGFGLMAVIGIAYLRGSRRQKTAASTDEPPH